MVPAHHGLIRMEGAGLSAGTQGEASLSLTKCRQVPKIPVLLDSRSRSEALAEEVWLVSVDEGTQPRGLVCFLVTSIPSCPVESPPL